MLSIIHILSHSPTVPRIAIRCSFQTVLYSLKSTFACNSFVTTVNILLQICDDCTASRQQKLDISVFKESIFVKEGDISPIKLNITIAFVSVVHILTVEFMLTQRATVL